MDNNDEVEELRARIKSLERALRQDDKLLAVTFKLTPQPANILGLLITIPLVTPEHIQQRAGTEAKVAVHRLRELLKPYGIQVQSKRKLGYWLDEETKGRIRQMITQQGSDEPAPVEASAQSGSLAAA